MSPKEKAQELFDKFKGYSWVSYVDGSELSSNLESAIKCALIAVNELIVSTQSKIHIQGEYYDFETTEYWIEVKQEIEKL